MLPESGGRNSSGIDEQNRDSVLYRVHAAALAAFQAGRILLQNERLFAGGANQNIEQILWNHDA